MLSQHADLEIKRWDETQKLGWSSGGRVWDLMLYHSTNSDCNSLTLPNVFFNRPYLPSGITINGLLWIGYAGTIRLQTVNVWKGLTHLASTGQLTHKCFHSHSPLLDDDDDGPEKQNEDHQAAGAGPEDQTHVLGMLGYLQSSLGVLTGSCTVGQRGDREEDSSTAHKWLYGSYRKNKMLHVAVRCQ